MNVRMELVLKRLQRDEAGMAMALAVIMIALLGVMGAGLLVFATTDLNTVIENNRGQRAFEMADAGVQAAKRQLVSDSNADHYDGGVGDIQWSESGSGVTLTDLDGDGDDEDRVTVKIESLPTGSFRVISAGTYGNAQRVIEATFRSVPLVNLPNAYYSGVDTTCNSNAKFVTGPVDLVVEGDVDFDSNCDFDIGAGRIHVGGNASFNSNTSLNGVQLYIGGDATFDSNSDVNNGSIYVGDDAYFDSNTNLNGASLFAGDDVTLANSNFSLGTANDPIYGNWQNSFNPTGRGAETRTGIGAAGTISGSGLSKAFKSSRSFDSTTTPRFVGSNAVSGQMNFPFDPAADMAEISEGARMTDEDIDELRAIAQRQEAENPGSDHFRPVADGTRSISSTGGWSSTFSDRYGYGTVVFYEFPTADPGNEVEWNINGSCSSTDRKGIIVVKNGSFELKGDGFNGWVVIRNGANDGNFSALSNECMNGYINANGTIEANSNAKIYDLSEDDIGEDLNDLRAVRELSWRECYSASCN